MELATIELKLECDPNHIVVKQKVTPAELVIYTAIHGEGCINNLTVTGADKESSVYDVMEKLRGLFQSKETNAMINQFFPGLAPSLPITFKSIGYDPAMFSRDIAAVNVVSAPNEEELESLKKRMVETAAKRVKDGKAETSEVTEDDIDDLLEGDENDDDEEAEADFEEEEEKPPVKKTVVKKAPAKKAKAKGKKK